MYRDVPTVLSEPLEVAKHGMYLPYCVSDVINGEITVELLNSTNYQQILYQGMELSKISCYDNTINAVSEYEESTENKQKWIRAHANVSSCINKK